MAKEKAAIPEGLAGKFEKEVDILATSLKAKRDELLKAIGTRPYQGIPVKEEERKSRYMQIRKDTAALTEIFKNNAKFKADGRVMLPRALIQQMSDMEGEIRGGKL